MNDDGHRSFQWIAPDLAQDLKASEVRHDNIQEHTIQDVAFHDLDGFATILCLDNLVAKPGQRFSKQISGGLVVVRNQNRIESLSSKQFTKCALQLEGGNRL